MSEQSLSDLKAENANEEANEEVAPQATEEEALEEAAEVEAEVNLLSDAEAEEKETEEAEVEDWMKGDDSPAEKKFTDGDIGAAKKKLKAKLESKHQSEVDDLQAQIEALKRNQPVGGGDLVRPSRTDFEDADDPEEAYLEALTDWKLNKNQAEQAASQSQAEMKQRQLEYQAKVTSAVDQHYERALELAEKSGISSDLYQQADLIVRQEVDRLIPGSGDLITDSLIANLGEGSEKVFYSLGVNKAKRAQFSELLKDDPSGIKAAMFLGSLKTELAPSKRKTNAPTPAPSVNGDRAADPSRRLKQAYQKASKSGDSQAAFNARREARKSGVDVSNW